MTATKLSKVYFTKPNSSLDFATEKYLIDYLKMMKAKSRLPINKMLYILLNKESDTVSCSRDDTDYSFFASQQKDNVSVRIKKLGEEIIEFDIHRKDIKKIIQTLDS